MQTVLCSVPTEVPGTILTRKRTDVGVMVAPKVAITSLNAWSEKNGFPTCKFYDIDMVYPSDEEIEKYFIENPADIVGLSAVVSTSYLQTKRIASIIKKINKKTLVVVGGYLTSAANTILRKTDVDLCVVGDGEIAWVGILQYMKSQLEKNENRIDIEKLLEVKGIAILDDDKKLRFSGYGQRLKPHDLNFPSFDYLKTGLGGNNVLFNNYFRPFTQNEVFIMDERSFDKGRKPNVAYTYLTKGCVAKCTFCQRGSKGYSVYDTTKLDEYLKDLKEKHDVGFIAVNDENWGSNIKLAYEQAEVLNKHNMLWSVSGVRCNSVNRKDLEYFQKMGCSYLKFGIESGSQTMLDVMEKKFTVDDIKRAIYTCNEIGLYSPSHGFLIGMPGESIKTCKESGKLMGDLAAHLAVPLHLIWGHVDIFYTIPLIGTPLYEYGKRVGLVGNTPDEEEEFLTITSNVAMYKRYYINLNGAPMTEVVFCYILVFLEASREYYKLMKGKKIDEKVVKRYTKRLEVQGLNPQVHSKQKNIDVMGAGAQKTDTTFNQYFITNYLKQHIVFNKTIANLPRFIVYPIVRYALYFEYLIQKYFFKDDNNLHRNINKKGLKNLRLNEDELDPAKTTAKDRSLRNIVARKLESLDRDEDDKLLTSLTGGP